MDKPPPFDAASPFWRGILDDAARTVVQLKRSFGDAEILDEFPSETYRRFYETASKKPAAAIRFIGGRWRPRLDVIHRLCTCVMLDAHKIKARRSQIVPMMRLDDLEISREDYYAIHDEHAVALRKIDRCLDRLPAELGQVLHRWADEVKLNEREQALKKRAIELLRACLFSSL